MLCADAIAGESPASSLFTDHDSVLPVLMSDTELEGQPTRD